MPEGIQTISFRERPQANRRGYISPRDGGQEPARLPRKRALPRLFREARGYFSEHAIDWTQYEPGIQMTDSDFLCDIVFVHKKTEAVIRLKEVWFNRLTGEINQAGNNYGELVS
jgi:hypothetical protein